LINYVDDCLRLRLAMLNYKPDKDQVMTVSVLKSPARYVLVKEALA
jgi:hypothetical protein